MCHDDGGGPWVPAEVGIGIGMGTGMGMGMGMMGCWIGVAEAAGTGLNTDDDALVDEGCCCRLAPLALIRALLVVGRSGSNCGGGATGVATRTVVKSTVCPPPTGPPRRRRTGLRAFASGDAVLRPAVAAVEDARARRVFSEEDRRFILMVVVVVGVGEYEGRFSARCELS